MVGLNQVNNIKCNGLNIQLEDRDCQNNLKPQSFTTQTIEII